MGINRAAIPRIRMKLNKLKNFGAIPVVRISIHSCKQRTEEMVQRAIKNYPDAHGQNTLFGRIKGIHPCAWSVSPTFTRMMRHSHSIENLLKLLL